jgi:NADH-quinone oxidoreductase subunit M
MVQTDIKRVIAYSSISHMAYILVGTFTFNMYGVTGGLYQMLNHGITISALFLMVGMLQERFGNLEIKKFGGVAKALPLLSVFFFIFTMSSIAVPMTNGFIGEFLILVGAYSKDPLIAYGAVLGVILGAVYMLWMFKKVFFGPQSNLVSNDDKPAFDLSAREIIVLTPLVILVFWMGLLPNNFINFSKASVDHLVKHRMSYSLNVGTMVQEKSIPAAQVETTVGLDASVNPATENQGNPPAEAQGDK